MAEPIRWQDRWWHQQPDGTWLLFNEETQTWEPYSGPVSAGPAYAPSPGMSTGVKWVIGVAIALVVLFIVMVLAAIAIPVFLRQRETGWISQIESRLKNAAIAQESYFVDNSRYTGSEADLEREGYQPIDGVVITVARADGQSYCLEGTHDQLINKVWSYDRDVGRPQEGPCL